MIPSSRSPETLATPSRSKNLLWLGLSAEAALFRKPLVVLATLALIFVPSLYVLIYVSSVWDPYGNLRQLPAGLVNDDQPIERSGKTVALGKEISETLLREQNFAFRTFSNAQSAKDAVRDGAIFFAVLIPADFSERATATRTAAPADIPIYLSEGGNYTASLISRRFGSELAHTVNESINRERWSALLSDGKPDQPSLAQGLASLQNGAERLAAGAVALHGGAGQIAQGLSKAGTGALALSEGAGKLSEGADQLTAGVKKIDGAILEIQSKLPNDDQMAAMAAGSRQLLEGTQKLQAGMDQLKAGENRLVEGAVRLQTGSARVPIWGKRVSAGAGELKAGLVTFGGGLDDASHGAAALSSGMVKVNTGVQPLTAGVIQLNAGFNTLASQLPKDDQLDLFAQSMAKLRDGERELSKGLEPLKTGAVLLDEGSEQLRDGAEALSAGIVRAQTRFQDAFSGAIPARLAAPVQAKIETIAPVPSNGPAFSPYFASLSLWIGAVMMSFIFHLRRIVSPMAGASRVSRWFAKGAFLYLIGICQATVVFFVLTLLLKIHFVNPAAVWEIAVIGSFAFVSLILFLMTVLGDAGRLLAVILLIFQLAASGGIYPVELSHSFYQSAHPYLPFSTLVRGFRATMFGAFDGQWALSAQHLLLVAVGSILLGLIFARWKYLSPEAFGPAVDV